MSGFQWQQEWGTAARVAVPQIIWETCNGGSKHPDKKTLRLFNPQMSAFLCTPAEEAARAACLATKLRELGLDPDEL